MAVYAETQIYCRSCQRHVLARKRATNHVAMKRSFVVLSLFALACGASTTSDGWDPSAGSGGYGGGEPGESLCVPGHQSECACPGWVAGVQRCREDGSGFEPCECQGDGSGGMPGTGGALETGGTSTGGGPQGPRCDWIPECAPLLGPCTVTYTVQCGSVDYGSVSCGGDTERRFGWAFGDGHSVMCPAGTSDCVDTAQEAAQYCADLMSVGTGGSGSGGSAGSGGTGGAGGTGGTGGGETVLWANDHQETRSAYLGGIATESYHRAILQFSINRQGFSCSVQVSTPARPTGWTGTTYFELTESQRECFRDDYSACGEPLLHLTWSSCDSSSGCVTSQGGPTRNVFRPVCSSPDLSGSFKVRHTVRALGPAGVDETWALVAAD